MARKSSTAGPATMRALATAAALVATIAVGWTLITGRTITRAHGWVFDGESYCAMAAGGRGNTPFSHRIVVPAFVRLLSRGSLTGRFRAVDLVALAAVA